MSAQVQVLEGRFVSYVHRVLIQTIGPPELLQPRLGYWILNPRFYTLLLICRTTVVGTALGVGPELFLALSDLQKWDALSAS